jgi:hypothetical protein
MYLTSQQLTQTVPTSSFWATRWTWPTFSDQTLAQRPYLHQSKTNLCTRIIYFATAKTNVQLNFADKLNSHQIFLLSEEKFNPLFSDSFWRAYYITCGHIGPVQTRQKVKKRGEGQKAQSRYIPIPIVWPPPLLPPRSLCTFHSTKWK